MLLTTRVIMYERERFVMDLQGEWVSAGHAVDGEFFT